MQHLQPYNWFNSEIYKNIGGTPITLTNEKLYQDR